MPPTPFFNRTRRAHATWTDTAVQDTRTGWGNVLSIILRNLNFALSLYILTYDLYVTIVCSNLCFLLCLKQSATYEWMHVWTHRDIQCSYPLRYQSTPAWIYVHVSAYIHWVIYTCWYINEYVDGCVHRCADISGDVSILIYQWMYSSIHQWIYRSDISAHQWTYWWI